MYTKSQSSATSFVALAVAAVGLFLATVVFGQSQDAKNAGSEQNQEVSQDAEKSQARRGQRRRRGRQPKTIDELPDGAQTLTMKNGKELYFHEGQLYTFAAARSKYVQIPQGVLTPGGRQKIRRSGQTNPGKIRQAEMRHLRKHRRHNQRFHRGRRLI